MIQVYKLTDEQVAAWSGKYGVHEFKPLKDADGNWIAGSENANNPAFPFTEELKQCPKIIYKPKIVSL